MTMSLPVSLIKIGGYRWSRDLIDWSGPGRGKKSKLLGYYKKEGKRGRPTAGKIADKIVDFWSVEAVYALFREERLIYIGEGILGNCLDRHYKTDEFAGRWDSFSWVSPCGLDVEASPPSLIQWEADEPITIPGKKLIEHLETVLIRLTEPEGNRQNPSDDKHIKWLTQTTEETHLTLEEKVDLLLDKILGPKSKRGKTRSKRGKTRK